MISRLPPWFSQEIPQEPEFIKKRLNTFANFGLHTVCLSACCPNLASCFKNNSVTFMIMGDVCSRNCRFCAVAKGRPKSPDLNEAYNLALNIRELGLRYVVITSVTRDDLGLGGATQFMRAAYLVKLMSNKTKVELLIPDFKAGRRALSLIAKAPVEIIGHNLETAERFYPLIRPKGSYRLSLSVIRHLKKLGFVGFIKSGILLGFGETEKEALKTIRDLRACGCDMLTLGQYLAPSKSHIPVKEFVSPEKFEFYRQEGLRIGFKFVSSGPLVRSSWEAGYAYSRIRG